MKQNCSIGALLQRRLFYIFTEFASGRQHALRRLVDRVVLSAQEGDRLPPLFSKKNN